MARVCEICGKKPMVGNQVSHAKNRTKRRWLPNLRTAKLTYQGATRYYKVCMRCLRTLQKNA